MSEEYEIDPELQKLDDSNERNRKTTEHFKGNLVNEAFLQDFEDLKATQAQGEKLLETMKKAILDARMGGEGILHMGKMVVFYTDVPEGRGIDWEALFKGVNGEPSREDIEKYSKVTRKGYTKTEVRGL